MFIEYVMTSELAIVFSELLFLMGVAHEIIDFTDLKKNTLHGVDPRHCCGSGLRLSNLWGCLYSLTHWSQWSESRNINAILTDCILMFISVALAILYNLQFLLKCWRKTTKNPSKPLDAFLKSHHVWLPVAGGGSPQFVQWTIILLTLQKESGISF